MQGLDFQVRLKFDDKEDCEEEVNCFSTYEEAEAVYHDRLKTEDEPCEIELVQVHVQHRIEKGGMIDEHESLSAQMRNLDAPIFCQDCKQEVEEIRRTRRDGVQQCSECVLAEEGPQA
jgi:hypothetical protein